MSFTPETFPIAIRTLLELNHYEVRGPVQIHGAEVDLVAEPRANPFGAKIYIEATVEYVDNEKYGKDVGKLAMVHAIEPDAQRLIVSSRGFSLPVKERANTTGIKTYTWDELFRSFERFDEYIARYTTAGVERDELVRLDRVYEEPHFQDRIGLESATKYLTNWRDDTTNAGGWIVVTGEYGTGKTALTKVLQYRWLMDYKHDPSRPLPLRIELRDFPRQFDARSLLHHFLDKNSLSHVSIDFVQSLIRQRRIIMLLDGYDEMAQYLHARERRTCLQALAELSAGGAKGLLTSRPNYFTEAEELQVFEVLYASLKFDSYLSSKQAAELLESERTIDDLLIQFIDRFERSLRDLTPEQTESLVYRLLSDDPEGCDVILSILRRIFRSVESGATVSLSGKPVVISYLLDVVDGLKDSESTITIGHITEWQIYTLIVKELMIRDLRRSPDIPPSQRRMFLWKLAVLLSKREHPVATEGDIKDLIVKQFRAELMRTADGSTLDQLERYFANLRSSATLTSSPDRTVDGWRFSHNSLREFLVADFIIGELELGRIVDEEIPISDAMRVFAASRSAEEQQRTLVALASAWKSSGSTQGRGQVLCLVWDGVLQLFSADTDRRRACLMAVIGEPFSLDRVRLTRLSLSSEADPLSLRQVSFREAALADIDFSGADLRGAVFSQAVVENVRFIAADLMGAIFSGSLIVDADMSGAKLNEADFTGVVSDDISLVLDMSGRGLVLKRLTGIDALGYLKFHGAKVDNISAMAVWQHHPNFSIVEKIVEKLTEGSLRQRRGLEQRGAARQDVRFGRAFVRYLENKGLISTPMNRKDLVEVTERGRDVFGRFVGARQLSDEIVSFLESR